MKTLVLGFSLAFVLVSSGCHLFLSDAGGEGQPCFDNKTCSTGLVCSAELTCVPAVGDGGVATDVGEPRRDGAEGDGPSAPDSGDAGSDAGSDTSFPSDASLDAGPDAGDAGIGPVITSIDGTGPAMGVSPRLEDEAEWNAHAGDRSPGQHRIDTAVGEFVVTGDRLAGVTLAQLQGQTGQGTHDMAIKEVGMNILRLGWPATLLAGGMFVLSVSGASGDASAQVYFLQGEPGVKGDQGVGVKGDKGDQGIQGVQGPAGTFSGTFNGDVTFTGNLSLSGTATVSSLSVTGQYSLPECPSAYARDTICAPWAGGCQGIILCKRGADEIVKVGDFWIDRYEAVIVDATQYNGGTCDGAGVPYGQTNFDYPSAFPRTGNFTGPMYACSIKGAKPSAYMTWFQAQEACALSGKQLCNNEEWQASVAGTYDSAGTETGGQCHIATTNTSARDTGLAGVTPGGNDSCVSKWGAEDMIGNLWEWVSMWGQAGLDRSTQQGEFWRPWDGFAETGDSDGTWNLSGEASGCDKNGSNCGYKQGLPAAAFRGGYWVNGPMSGAFALHLGYGPSNWSDSLGFRCCRGR
ncbi:MAG: SUMF1/EgtB/PvdO family nonheme iron enzyme [Deltaproteobacteria bacterium]|nr:SUMF1/EgtB/PvdO family nonheme iron enzyme [Deltaproteobacteria bacterium]